MIPNLKQQCLLLRRSLCGRRLFSRAIFHPMSILTTLETRCRYCWTTDTSVTIVTADTFSFFPLLFLSTVGFLVRLLLLLPHPTFVRSVVDAMATTAEATNLQVDGAEIFTHQPGRSRQSVVEKKWYSPVAKRVQFYIDIALQWHSAVVDGVSVYK